MTLLPDDGTPTGPPAVIKAILYWRLLSSANVTHIEASPGSSLFPHYIPPPWLPPLPASVPHWRVRLPGLRPGLRLQVGWSHCLCEERSQGKCPAGDSHTELSSRGQEQSGKRSSSCPLGLPCSWATQMPVWMPVWFSQTPTSF